MKRILFMVWVVLLVAFFYAMPSRAQDQGGAVFPRGGNNADMLVKAGDNRPENDQHFRWINKNINAASFMIFDDKSITTWLPFAYFAPVKHGHVVKDITDMDTYKIPACINADASALATKASTATNADKSDKAGSADNSTQSKNATHAPTVTFSKDGYPVKAGLNNTMVWSGTAWVIGPSLPEGVIDGAIYEYTAGGDSKWTSIKDFMDTYVAGVPKIEVTIAMCWLGMGLGSLFVFLGGLILIIQRIAGYGYYPPKGSASKAAALLLGLVLVGAMASSAYADQYIPIGGDDASILAKKGGPEPANDYNFRFLNDNKKTNVLIGFDDDSLTDFTPIGSYSKTIHVHPVTDVTDIATYTITAASHSDKCADCAVAAKTPQCGTAMANCKQAAASDNCEEAVTCGVADKCAHGLPAPAEGANLTMYYDHEQGWQTGANDFPGKTQANTMLMTDDKKQIYMGSKDTYVAEMANASAWFGLAFWLLIAGVPLMLAMGVYSLVFTFRQAIGWDVGNYIHLNVDGKESNYKVDSIDGDLNVHLTGGW